MATIAILLATVVAAGMALAAPAVLRGLPAPDEEPELRFADLDTGRFRLALCAACAVAGAILLLTTNPPLWPVWAPMAGLGPLLGLIDARTGFLPLRLNYFALGLVSAGAVASCWLRTDWRPALVALAGGVGATACYWVLWRLSRGQLGFGDVRLAGLLGVATGATSPTVLVWSFVIGSLVGAVWAIGVRITSGEHAFPYGPSMLAGVPAALLLSVAIPAG